MREKLNEELLREQKSVDEIYELFDLTQEVAKRRLDEIYATHCSSVFSAVYERDAFATYFENLLSVYQHAENRLVFGKLVYEPKATPAQRYIGRIGLVDNDAAVKLVDWRSPSGSDFYQATREENRAVSLRRHILLKGREVGGFEDEVLSESALNEQLQVNGEGALFLEMSRSRGKYMRDIIATIQKEQDVIIRSPLSGTLVIQGGPGTGKTAVALHRVAYLLYTHKEALENSGVLIIGPSNVFLNYIDKVLPSLGETGTTSCTINQLSAFCASRTATQRELLIKGKISMTKLLKNAVEDYISCASCGIKVHLGEDKYAISRDEINEHIQTARTLKKKYTSGRKLFVKSLLEHIVKSQVSVQLLNSGDVNADVEGNRKFVMRELLESDIVRLALNLAWMPLTPEYFLRKLFTSRSRLERASEGILDAPDIEYLLSLQSQEFEFSDADLPLLDEAAWLIGSDDAHTKKRRKQQNQELKDAKRFAKGLLKSGGILQDVRDFVDESALVLRNFVPEIADDQDDGTPFGKRKKFKHIVVDEAQELSPMQWRMVARRSTNGSYTIVGDIFQTSSMHGVANKKKTVAQWKKLSQYISGAVKIEELTVNYRNTTEIAKLAETVAVKSGLKLADKLDSHVRAPRSVPNSVDSKQVTSILEEMRNLTRNNSVDEKTAVILPDELFESVSAATSAQCYTPQQVKGLEFDRVVLLEPLKILQVCAPDLYVALTRATTHLTIIYTTTDPFFKQVASEHL
jgi:DNA helicase IV